MTARVRAESAQVLSVSREFDGLDFKPHSSSARGHARIGPFKIEYSASGNRVSVKARVKLGSLSKTVASATLTPRKASVSGKANAMLVKVSISLRAVFDPLGRRRLTASAKVCHKQISKLRLRWKCKKIAETKIVAW